MRTTQGLSKCENISMYFTQMKQMIYYFLKPSTSNAVWNVLHMFFLTGWDYWKASSHSKCEFEKQDHLISSLVTSANILNCHQKNIWKHNRTNILAEKYQQCDKFSSSSMHFIFIFYISVLDIIRKIVWCML
jgi:hypothetical protein